MTTEEYDLAYMTGELQIDSNNFIEVGKWLMKKKNKTEEEREAAIAFKKYYHQTLWIRTVPFFFIMLSFLLAHFQYPNFFKGPYDIWTSGTFKDGNIKFIGEEGNRRQESPEELGLDSKKMNKGDKVSIYLDKYGRILVAQVDNFWTKFFLFMGPFYISPVFIVLGIIFLWMMIGRFTFSRPYYRWKAKVNSGKYERSL